MASVNNGDDSVVPAALEREHCTCSILELKIFLLGHSRIVLCTTCSLNHVLSVPSPPPLTMIPSSHNLLPPLLLSRIVKNRNSHGERTKRLLHSGRERFPLPSFRLHALLSQDHRLHCQLTRLLLLPLPKRVELVLFLISPLSCSHSNSRNWIARIKYGSKMRRQHLRRADPFTGEMGGSVLECSAFVICCCCYLHSMHFLGGARRPYNVADG